MSEAYKIGDRVVYTGRLTLKGDKTAKHAGTVHDLGNSHIAVMFDEHPDSVVVFHGIQVPFERQPVEPDCYVRWITDGPDYLDISTRKVVEVYTPDPGWSHNKIVRFEDGKKVWLKDVVRVADPEPVAVEPKPVEFEAASFTVTGFDIDASPAIVFENGRMYINAVAMPPPMHVTSQINKLAEFITAHHADKITADEGAADTAIRIMTDMQARIDNLDRMNKNQSNTIDDYMARERAAQAGHAPVIFKRGDLIRGKSNMVRWHNITGRIITPMTNEVTSVELMTEAGTFYPNVPLDAFEHVR